MSSRYIPFVKRDNVYSLYIDKKYAITTIFYIFHNLYSG